MASFLTPRGTQDILPDEWRYWNFVLCQVEEVTRLFGYRRIETPTFAETNLFARTSGAGSDVVEKEMYSFKDRGGDDLTLRPEGTAPIMRAYLQHGMNKLSQPVKLFYVERMYRYDRPQRGRFREHHQFGCEAIGLEDAYVDVEMIALLHTFYLRLGLTDLSLHINSIGDSQCRPRYVAALVAYLEEHADELAPADRDRLQHNPLRVLDTKETSTQRLLPGAPSIQDYLCEGCRSHWEHVRHGLEVLGIEYEIDPRLVRGLDYYTRTTFEFMPPSEGAQSTVGGGGRYDALSAAMGGPPVPGVGFGTGIERLVLNLKERDIPVPPAQGPVVYFAHRGVGTEDRALALAQRLRQAGIAVDVGFGDRSLKAQMKQANSYGARYAAIVGEDELLEDTVTLRALDTGEEQRLPVESFIEFVTGPLR